MLQLYADNTFTGGVTIDEGTLEIGAAGSAGTGPITFAGPAATLQLDATTSYFADTLTGLAIGDSLDLRGAFDAFAAAAVTGSNSDLD